MASWIDIEPLLIRSVRGAMERATFSRDLSVTAIGKPALPERRSVERDSRTIANGECEDCSYA
ncbi:hypothetical protein [Oxynema aestuarii]|jgi:hypothetical protein|uniref:Uncharacterized protein n=1 Tax=Oxynema aestuarii AP17 TaxID=2064643 RepID=A0A6H1TVW6_9CYAN|nr:hypothetical protein [Oxynema aestuarii]QIZ70080.1 hypothetical protein HCG48_05445 [Oxynema aestuarii AP17]RMH76752.1 MAG: hypothetical protein D6680_07530 [Cyanobacteria bacterium J007]